MAVKKRTIDMTRGPIAGPLILFILPLIEVFGGAVRAMGYSLRSMIIVIVNFCALRLILLYVLSGTAHSLKMLAAAYPVTWATSAVSFITAFFLIMKKYKTKENTLKT